jgi:hypothetical protein
MSKKHKGGNGKGNKPDDNLYDSSFDAGKWIGGGKGSTFKASCYESHPEIPLGAGILYGGSCSSPIIKDANVYVGLDGYMSYKQPRYPWVPETPHTIEEVAFKISDGCAPSDKTNFVLMIDWLRGKLEAGKKVHVGCIGGHGRTGMVLAALVKEMTGEEDAITWVRKHYCKKAVESTEQVKFLTEYFGIKKVKGSHSTRGFGFLGGTTYTPYAGTGYPSYHGTSYGQRDWMAGGSGNAGSSGGITHASEYIPGTNTVRSKGPRELTGPPGISGVRFFTPIDITGNSVWGDDN